MASSKRPLEDFFLSSSEDEGVYDGANSTTVDDSYLAHLSERLEKGSSSPPEPKLSSGVVAAGHGPAPSQPPPPPSQKDPSDIIEVGDADLVALQSSVGPSTGLEAPLEPGPSDLLKSVPPPPAEEETLDPQLDPATYDAPTFVRPSLIDQDPAPVLEIIEGNEQGRSYRLEKDVTTIGRGLDNDIVLTDIAVSRRHLRLCRQGMEVSVEDNGSGNGTVINGGKVSRASVHGGDRVEVGNTIVRVVFPGQSSFPPPQAVAQPPAPAPGNPVHQKSTMYLSDGQPVLDQIASAPPAVIVAPPPSTPPTHAAAESTGHIPIPQPAKPAKSGSPKSFRTAMTVLAVIICVIGMVGLVAAVIQYLGDTTSESAADQPSVEELSQRARSAYMDRRWGEAAHLFEQVLALDPNNAQARRFAEQARAEARNQGELEVARQAMAEENFELAISSLRSIPSTSVYLPESNERRAQAEKRLAASLVAEARRHLAAGDTSLARARADRAKALAAADPDVRALWAQLEGDTVPTDGGTAAPTEVPGPVVAVNNPGTRIPPTHHIKNQNKNKRSNVKGQVLPLYKGGQFGAAVARAKELAATASTDRDRNSARTLARRIEAFARAWNGSKSGSQTQKLQFLKQARRFDRDISGGYYGPKIAPRLSALYVSNAKRAWQAGQYNTACSSARSALMLDRSASSAASFSSKCDTKAREYYAQGKQAERRNAVGQAKELYRKVINMVNRSSPWYNKAYKALNAAGRGRQDEDE